MRMGRLSFVVTDLLFMARQTWASDYYVAKTGSDSNPCSSVAPCLTIDKGIAAATLPGDTVVIRAGTYVESISNWNSGAPGKPITVKAAPGDEVIWRSANQDLSSL